MTLYKVSLLDRNDDGDRVRVATMIGTPESLKFKTKRETYRFRNRRGIDLPARIMGETDDWEDDQFFPLTCPHCGSENLVRTGTRASGSTRHKCRDCGKTSIIFPKPKWDGLRDGVKKKVAKSFLFAPHLANALEQEASRRGTTQTAVLESLIGSLANAE
jgi:ribosomal protein S27E